MEPHKNINTSTIANIDPDYTTRTVSLAQLLSSKNDDISEFNENLISTILNDSNINRRSTQRRIKPFEALKIQNFLGSKASSYPAVIMIEMSGYYERLIQNDGSGLLLDIVDENLMKNLKKKLCI